MQWGCNAQKNIKEGCKLCQIWMQFITVNDVWDTCKYCTGHIFLRSLSNLIHTFLEAKLQKSYKSGHFAPLNIWYKYNWQIYGYFIWLKNIWIFHNIILKSLLVIFFYNFCNLSYMVSCTQSKCYFGIISVDQYMILKTVQGCCLLIPWYWRLYRGVACLYHDTWDGFWS